ncbi:MAG: hypothetical protein K2O58_05055 [Bacteroidales bacterium]|nr:hypothetical protein [Bacteroidales bacterium]MDE7127245.1 hypothetical protein [Bacteroidales bacterium]
MKNAVQNFGIMFPLLLIAQVLISNYFNFSPYAMLSILPAMILCLPVSMNTIWVMAIAFASGLAVDFLAEGLLGLNTLALVPVALSQKTVIRVIMGEDLLTRQENFSFKKNGAAKISYALVIVQAIFFMIYIFADGAGVRPMWFNMARFAGAMACTFPLSLVTVNILSSSNN